MGVFACLVAMALAEAEPKADADPYYGYGYGLGYAGYHGLGYAGYGYGLGHLGYRGYYGYGKRSAEAEADPYYGYYGHGYHGLGYGRAYGYGLVTTDTPVLDTTEDTTDTVLVTTARGPLRPSPPLPLRPRLIPTTDTTAMDTTVLDTDVPTDTEATTATEATAVACTDTTVKCPSDSSQPKTILGITSSSSEKWIAQFGLIPTSATSFSATRLAQARNGEQEAKE